MRSRVLTRERARVAREFNDRSKFVYIMDANYGTPDYFSSMYYEIATGKFWEICFHYKNPKNVRVADYTSLVFPAYILAGYDKERILGVVESFRHVE